MPQIAAQKLKAGDYTWNEQSARAYTNNSMTPAIYPVTLSPYLRIALAGFDIRVNAGADGKFKLSLLRGEEVVAVARAARSGHTPVAEADRRARLNLWGGKSDFHLALQRFADIAEALAPNKNV